MPDTTFAIRTTITPEMVSEALREAAAERFVIDARVDELAEFLARHLDAASDPFLAVQRRQELREESRCLTYGEEPGLLERMREHLTSLREKWEDLDLTNDERHDLARQIQAVEADIALAERSRQVMTVSVGGIGVNTEF